MALSDAKKKLGDKYNPVNLFLLYDYNYDNWLDHEESADTTRKSDKEESYMPPLKRDKEESYMPPLEGIPPLEGDAEEVKKEKD